MEHALKMAVTWLEVENGINRKIDTDVRADLSQWLRNIMNERFVLI
ncbi:hypothetical protein [Bartonella bacilliformis]